MVIHTVIPPKYAVSQVVNRIKVNTSRQMKQKFSFLEKVYWGTQSVWSTGYFVSTVGVGEAVIRNYVAMQGREDTGQAELDLLVRTPCVSAGDSIIRKPTLLLA